LSLLLLISIPPAGAQTWHARIWEPVPFAKMGAVPSQTQHRTSEESSSVKLQVRREHVEHLNMELDEQEAALTRAEEELTRARSQHRDWQSDLRDRQRNLKCQKEAWLHSWAAQETMLLHLIVFRLVRIQAAAAGMFLHTGESDELADNSEANAPSLAGTQLTPVDKRWADVEILTCIPGSMGVVAGEFPVHSIFRASTPLSMRNLCEDEIGVKVATDPLSLLELVLHAVEFARVEESGRLPTLFYVVFSTHAFFNELPDAQTHGGTSAAALAARRLTDAYEAVLADAGVSPHERPVVVATERICRHGNEAPCTAEEASTPFLYAGGFAGSAEGLSKVAASMLQDLSAKPAGTAASWQDATVFLRRFAQRPQSVGLVVGDHRQRLFGSLAEAVPGPCPEGQGVTTFCIGDIEAAKKKVEMVGDNVSRCCPAASSFDWLHETYYSPYAVEGCVLRREGRMPISWHGDGLGKWTYLLALTDLAFNCHRIARLVITNHPTDMLDHLFSLFAATQKPGSAQPDVPDYEHKQR
jgi:hypothetical protein